MAKIGKHAQAKKYKELREKQALANRMIKRARVYLKPEHKALKNLKAKKKQFYNTRGIKSPAQLSFVSLSRKDLKAYERLLDSIINDTYLNEEKYNNFKSKREQQFRDMGVEDVDMAVEVLESDVVADLIALGLSPSKDIMPVLAQYEQSGFGINEFLSMCHLFMNEINTDNATIDDFFVFADYYIQMNNDFMRRVQWGEYEVEQWNDYLNEYYVAGRWDE